MRYLCALTGLLTLSSLSTADSNITVTDPLTSKQILSNTFRPPQVFKNVNLLRNTNLEKGYVRETVNVVIENVDSEPQDKYYYPFEGGIIGRVGGFEVKDRKAPEKAAFNVENVEFDTYEETQYYLIHLPEPLSPAAQLTISISYTIHSVFVPRPALIQQPEKQYLLYTFSAYCPSVYTTAKQKTRLKLPSQDIPDYTVLPPSSNADGHEDPQRQGSTFVYGPYGDIPAGASEPVSVRYEFTKPVNHASSLERDVELSHWGGNIAFEERYDLHNLAAGLKNQFSRLLWQQQAYLQAPTTALKELTYPLQVGSMNPYFVDDIGNVSTSRFRSNLREANLELKPRYPVFGGWKYKFKVGWDADSKSYLRKLRSGDGYVLKVPFLEGPKQPEGVSYEKIVVRVILPEGARNVKYEIPVPIAASDISLFRSFMDTVGRTTLKLTAFNLVDEDRDRELIVTYDYPFTAALRKPISIFGAVLSVFVAAYVVSRIDTSIGRKMKA